MCKSVGTESDVGYDSQWCWFCCQADSDGVVHRYCPSHLEDSELKPNVTCAVYNHDGTGITTLMLLCVTYPHYLMQDFVMRAL